MTMRIGFGRIAGAGFALLAAGAIVWLLWPKPILVDAATATKGRFVATVDEDGKTRVRERYVVAAPLAGQLTRVRLKVGDKVNADDVIATILPSQAPFLDPRSRREAEERLGAAEATVERAKASVDRTQAQSDQAQQELTRTRALFDRGATTAQALERADVVARTAERDLRAAEFLRHASEHEVSQARALLAQHVADGERAPDIWNVTAPVSGLVLKVAQESETAIQSGAPILEIGDPRDLEIVVDVLSTDAVEVRPDAEATIEHWGGPGTLLGRVRRVEPEAFTKISTLGVEEQRVNVLIDILSPQEQWTGLGDAFQVDAKITVFVSDDAITVPTGALFRTGEQWSLFVIKNGRAERRSVTLLRRSGRVAAVLAGLSSGEQVIVYPSDQIETGARVVARQTDHR